MAKETVSISNRQAFRDFHIEKAYEAGLQLFGNEVKSLRRGLANLQGAFAKIEGGEVYIYHMHINPYEFTREETDPLRQRKLLLNKSEIHQIMQKVEREGYTIVPIKVYFKKRYAKVEIALAKGKKLHDRREDIKKKEVAREIRQATYRRR
jgi:SsrA-binding protein